MRHIAISGSFNASEWSDSVGMSWVDCWMTWFHILEGEIGGGKKVRMKNHLFGNRTAPRLLLKHAKARKTHEKHQLPTTSFYDKTLFEPALPPLAGGLPCHLPAVGTGRKHNPEDCRSLGWTMTNPDDLGCALASLWPFAAARRSNAVCFSCDKNCRQWWGSKLWTMLNPSLFATPLSLMQAMTSFKLPLPPPLLPQCCQTARESQIAPPAERKNSLDGFEGIAFRISQWFNMFQSMLHLHHAAYCDFGFL